VTSEPPHPDRPDVPSPPDSSGRHEAQGPSPHDPTESAEPPNAPVEPRSATTPQPPPIAPRPPLPPRQPRPSLQDEDDTPFDPLAPPPPPSAPSPTPAPSLAIDRDREDLLAALYADITRAADPAPEPDTDADETSPADPTLGAAHAAPADPWAHRRGEPRIFAFFWSIYVLLAVAGSILWLTRLPVISATTYSPAARTLLVVIAAGICILWPMTRLSQLAPENRPLSALLADLFIVLAPVQMVVWPMMILAAWPIEIVAAVAALLTAWAALAGGILALAFSGRCAPGPVVRTTAMIACTASALVAPAVLAVEPLRSGGTLAWLHACSPFTGVFAVTGSGWAGPTTGVRDWHWAGILLALALALGCWAAALARAGAGSLRPSGLH
jgi:hypothetical protein